YPSPTTTPISSLSLHDALPIFMRPGRNTRPGGPVRARNAQGEAMRLLTRRRPGPVLLGLAAAGMAAAVAVPASASAAADASPVRSEEHTSELQSRGHLVCRLLL